MQEKWKIKIGEKIYKSEQVDTVSRLLHKLKDENRLSEDVLIMRPGEREWKNAREIEEFEGLFIVDKLTLEEDETVGKEPREKIQDGKCPQCGSENPPDSLCCDFCKLPFKKKRESAQPGMDLNFSGLSEKTITYDFNIKEVLIFAFSKLKERPLFFAAVILFSAVFYSIMHFVSMFAMILTPLFSLLLVIIGSALFSIGFFNIFIVTARGGRASFSDFSTKSHLLFNMILLDFITFAVIFFFSILVVLIFEFLLGNREAGMIIGSVILAYFYLRFFFSQIILVDKEYGPAESLIRSWKITRKKELKLVVIMIIAPLLLFGVLTSLLSLFSMVIRFRLINYIWGLGILYVLCIPIIALVYAYTKLEGRASQKQA